MILKCIIFGLAFVAIALISLRLLFPLPVREGFVASSAIPASTETEFGRRKFDGEQRHPGKTGILPLVSGADALGSRMALIAGAQRSIDAQYYIWHNDASGQQIMRSLIAAAARGVRVRLLLDDNGVGFPDRTLAAIDALDNIEVRLFNPATLRRPKLLSFAFDFVRMNRRMHNKALIVDGSAAIIGGRNIGDEYFAVGDETPFLDLDVLALGAVVDDTASSFDAYWNSGSSYPVSSLMRPGGSPDPMLAAIVDSAPPASLEGARVSFRSTVEAFRANGQAPGWYVAHLVVDDPAKGLGQVPRDKLLMSHLGKVVGPVDHRIDMVSAYFIVGKEGETWIEGLAQSGKTVRIATNALNTTDVPAVHAGYARYRKDLLAAGAQLFEIRLGAVGTADKKGGKGLGISRASLHAKSFAVDDQRIFIGSFNFDPRSILLNCEMGYVIESPPMASAMRHAFDTTIPQISYRPSLDAQDRLVWSEPLPDGSVRQFDKEPQTTLWQRMTVAVVSLLPVEWLL